MTTRVRVLRPTRPLVGSGRLPHLERTVVRVRAAILLAVAVTMAMPLVLSRDLSPEAFMAHVLPVVVFVGCAIDTVLHGERLRQVVITGMLTVTIAASGLFLTPRLYDGTAFTVGMFALSAARTLTMPAYVVANVFVVGIWALGRGLFGHDAWAGIDEALLGSTMALAAAAFSDFLEAGTREAEAADATTRAERRALVEAESRRRAVAAAERAMHDDVLHALRLTSAAATYGRDLVREASGSAVESLANLGDLDAATLDAPNEMALASLAARWRDTGELTVALDLTEAALGARLRAEAWDATERAVGEALRNVARHSGQTHATITADVHDGALHLSVVDAGRGLTADHVPGFGMQRSIADAVAAAGGHAEVAPAPTGGAVMRLELPVLVEGRRGLLATSHDLSIGATHTPLPLQLVAIPIGLAFTTMALRASFAWAEPGLALALTFAEIATTAAVVHRLTRRPPTWSWLVLIVATLVGIQVAGLIFMPAGALLDNRSFLVGFTALPLMLLVIALPIGVGLATIAPFPILVVVAWLVHPEVGDDSFPVGAVQATMFLPAVTLQLGWMLRRIGRAIRAEEHALAELAALDAQRRSAELIERHHLGYTRRVVAPWLADIAAGHLDLTATETGVKAQLLAHNVRDDLYAPGYLDEAQRSAADRFRRRGGTLRLRPSTAGRCDEACGDLLMHLMTHLPGDRAITVIPSVRPAQPVRVTVVPPVPDMLSEPHGWSIERDPVHTVFWRGRHER